MSNNLTDAIKEAYIVAPSNDVVLETLQFIHPSLAEDIFLVLNREDLVLQIEGAVSKTFIGTAFRFTLPAAGDNGIQELTLTMDNVDRRITDFINTVKASAEPVVVKYRPYLSSDYNTPQMDPPLTLNLTGIRLTLLEATGKATFVDIVNRKAPSELYTRARFPSLGQ